MNFFYFSALFLNPFIYTMINSVQCTSLKYISSQIIISSFLFIDYEIEFYNRGRNNSHELRRTLRMT